MANFVANILQDPYWRKTLTRASYATKIHAAETSQKWHVLDVSHVNRRGVLSKNANQRNGFHGEVLHSLGE